MKRFFYVANLKMNGSLNMISSWLEKASELSASEQETCIFCPPSCFLDHSSHLIKKNNLNIRLGAQNFDADSSASITGGISANMMSSLDCQYTLIGHSERRILFKEDDNLLVEKLRSAFSSKLKVIFCVGETEQERLDSLTFEKLYSQLGILKNFSNFKDSIVVAYEPIWSIGSGKIPRSKEIQEVLIFIKDSLSKIFQIDSSIPLLYGGSVVHDNVDNLRNLPELEGLLIGGASIDPEDFCKIVKPTT